MAQLKTNTTDLQSIIDKVNALPDATSIETCTLTLTSDGSPMPPNGLTVCYVSDDLVPTSANISEGTLTIAKGTVLTIYNGTSTSEISGNATEMVYNTLITVIAVNGDFAYKYVG